MNIDPDKLGVEWNHTVTIRGAIVPLLPPRKVDGGNAGAPRGWLVALALGVWRFARSAFVRRDDVAAVRAQVRLVVPAAYRDLVDRMDDGELATVYSVYMGLQSAWMMELAVASSKATLGRSDPAAALHTTPGSSARAPVASVNPGGRGIPLKAGRLPQHVLGGVAWGRAVSEAKANQEGASKAV